MKKQHIIYAVVGIAALILIAGGWYVYKYRECVEKVSYVPPREQGIGGGFSGYQLDRIANDKGDYYNFMSRKFKTSDDAMRACIWK